MGCCPHKAEALLCSRSARRQLNSHDSGVLTVQEGRLTQAACSFQFDTSLAPYNLGALQQWRSLSGHITRPLIQMVAPVNGRNLSVTTEADPFLKGPRTAAEERLAQQLQAKARMGSDTGQSTARSGPEADHSAANIGAESSHAAASGKAGSASVHDTQTPAKQTQKGVGRCFYTVVPTRATVRTASFTLVSSSHICMTGQ